MAKFSSIYKQTAPTRRIVSGENSYEKGMLWSNQALGAGYTRTLLNLEVDTTTGALVIPGGFLNTSVAAGCTFLDNIVTGSGSEESGQVIVLQSRNEYCMRAWEGITNILSVQKIAIKNNQDLVDRLRQQGIMTDSTVCYKILTYNPINHRLMIVTLIKAARDKYFTLTPAVRTGYPEREFQLRRLNVNPISCGFSEVWESDAGLYISNKLDYHPEGAEDTFIPRVRRNRLNETFGQELYSPHHMQTIAHCEGFGNKTFMFTNKKQINLSGPVVKQIPIVSTDIYRVLSFKTTNEDYKTGATSLEDAQKYKGNWGHAVGDIINIYTTTAGDNIENVRVKVLSTIDYAYYVGDVLTYTITGVISAVEYLSTGIFKRNANYPHTSWAYTTTGSGSIVADSIVILSYEKDQLISVEEGSIGSDYQYDTYLGNMHTGLNTKINPTIASVPVPVDAYRFGIALTSLGIKSSLNSETTPTTLAPIDASDLWDKAVANKVEALGKVSDAPVIGIDLNTGFIKPCVTGLTTGSYLEIVKLPVLTRDNNANDTPLTSLFQNDTGIVKIENWDDSKPWTSLADLLLDSVGSIKRIGQGIRIAAYCKVLIPLNRYLKTLTDFPIDTDYYTPNITRVFVLDYVWNGKEWEFSFVDTSAIPTAEANYLTENWDQKGTDAVGNRIARHYIWLNTLSYTDIITEDNIEDMPRHIVDGLVGLKAVANKETGEILGAVMDSLELKLDETLNDVMYLEEAQNRTKMFDTSFGHFEVTPKTLTPAEAALWGYNMLSPTPYTFDCSDTPLLEPQITGVLLMRNGQPLLKPIVNTPGVLYIYFNADFSAFETVPADGGGYQLIVEYKNIYDEWRVLKEYSVTETHSLLSAGRFIELPFSSPDEIVLIKTTITDRNNTTNVALTDGTTEEHYVVASQLITTLNYSKDLTQNSVSPKIYDLGTALGMTYWKGRLVCWGIVGAENMLFTSEPNEPEYFSYPNGVDTFEENIVHVISYSDSLIVFTSTKLWKLDMGTDGLSWSKTLLQQNLRTVDRDVPYIVILKNMLFFKSDKQFYMLVPKSSGTVGELTIAPISKTIQDFLLNPWSNITDIITSSYNFSKSVNFVETSKTICQYLVKYGAHVEQSKIFVDWWFDLRAWEKALYGEAEIIEESQVEHDAVFEEVDLYDNPSLSYKVYWLVQLVYDTQTYSWTIRTHSVPHIGCFVSDAANKDTDLISLVFSPEPRYDPDPYGDTDISFPLFTEYKVFNNAMWVEGGDKYAKASWGVAISNRTGVSDIFLDTVTVGEDTVDDLQNRLMEPYAPRFQVFDTGYKEVSSPVLKKHFREIQFTFEPRAVQEIYTDYTVGIRAALLAQIDGQTVMSSVSQEVVELYEGENLVIKVYDRIDYQDIAINVDPMSIVPLPYLVDSELSNTFVLESSALSGVKQVKVRRAVNGKGHLIRMRFTNITEANYAIINHAFISHNKNAR